MKPLLRLNGYDVCVAAAIVLLALAWSFALWTPQGDGQLWVEVSADGEVLERFPLETLAESPRVYRGGGYTLRAAFDQGGVLVEEADCPTQDCVRTGVIRRGGQSIVCLPARIVIRLTGGQQDGVDTVIG